MFSSTDRGSRGCKRQGAQDMNMAPASILKEPLQASSKRCGQQHGFLGTVHLHFTVTINTGSQGHLGVWGKQL